VVLIPCGDAVRLIHLNQLGLLVEHNAVTGNGGDKGDDPLVEALHEIDTLRENINVAIREAKLRSKLVQWQERIRGKFPSPLVQPHRLDSQYFYPHFYFDDFAELSLLTLPYRRLIMDGLLRLEWLLTIAAQDKVDAAVMHKGNLSVEQEISMSELKSRWFHGILCNDLLVLCADPELPEIRNPYSQVALWAAIRKPMPSIVKNTSKLSTN
jgi:hypothetical protein